MFDPLKEIWKSLKVKERNQIKSGFQFILLVSGLSILVLPFVFTRKGVFSWMDFSETGQIGDTINGIATPFIALLGALLTFLAFYIQYKANEQQRDDIKLERFDTKYYELVRLHKDNVNEIRINNESFGRTCFADLYNELRLSFYAVKFHIEDYPAGTTDVDLGIRRDDDEAILKIAYLLFFIGLGDSSERLWFEQMNKICAPFLSQNLRVFIQSQQPQKDVAKYDFILHNGDRFQYVTVFKPFVGHMHHLGHYYRHLYQIVKYIDERNDYTDIEKYQYTKTLRAQLSSYEQILLYYNTFSRFGRPWLAGENPYLIKYRMIKNIPLPLADFGMKPEDKFKDEVERTKDSPDKFFEWHEV